MTTLVEFCVSYAQPWNFNIACYSESSKCMLFQNIGEIGHRFSIFKAKRLVVHYYLYLSYMIQKVM